jgi:hypothetical protein
MEPRRPVAPQFPLGPSESASKKWKVGSRDKNRTKLLIIAVSAVAGLLLIGVVAAILLIGGDDKQKPVTTTNGTNRQSQPAAFAQQYLRDCTDRDVSFTAAPIPIAQMGYIEPMGKVQDGHVTPTDHVYVSPKSMNAADNTTDVVMPADGTVIEVGAMPAQYIGDQAQQTAPEDHRLIIAHNCRYVSIFIHVHQLSDALKTAVGGKMEPNTQKQVSVVLKAGDKLGKIGGNPVDWSLMDATKTLSGFITPSLYNIEPWKIHVIDPLSVYKGAAREQLIEKSLRTSEPYGGKIDYDQKGTLRGNWFRQGTNGYAGASQERYWDGHLSIAPDYLDPSTTIFSVGNWEGTAAQMTVRGNVDPLATTPRSSLIKYEVLTRQYRGPGGQSWTGPGLVRGLTLSQSAPQKGTVLLQVLEGERLKMELFPGKVASDVSDFTDAAQIYIR